MEKEEVNVLTNVIIAFSTFVGVGGAVAYYMKEILSKEIDFIILALMVYILTGALTLLIIKGRLK